MSCTRTTGDRTRWSWLPAPPDSANSAPAIALIRTKMLADRLRELLDAGVVNHGQLPSGPAIYTLTPDSRALMPAP
ncbi:winged helix-turn-helix transcriptional regulator [Streptomyces sp. NBC_00190]|uniref:winged helix-turn-helix transcriptional regulator n=1 Tax=unclassified Streptomyces TaxID=2593676 RepID=UPI002E2C1313|nr:winged helix-turn-helix transcriptional regulator [Streptomyces sp. NBC_00190]WSZ38250.1 winged helix-turn-helix transcriptional regulator [Streptomyces sp. NBC_00868]